MGQEVDDERLKPIGFYEIFAGFTIATVILLLALVYAVDYFIHGDRP